MSSVVKLIRPRRDPLGEDLPAPLRRGLLALCCLALAIPAFRILGSVPILGDDHSSHMAAVHHLLTLLRAGQTDLHCPTFNLGFPMYLYYQPLPHVTAALVHVLSFGVLGEQAAFNLTVAALWCSYPLAIYHGARKLGLGPMSALVSAALAPAVSSSLSFGLTLHSVMGLGLYTQLFAMVLLPLCVGWTWAALQSTDRGLRALLPAAGLMVLLWLSHAFYGMAAATASVVMVLCSPSTMRRTLPRLLVMGAITVGSLLFWLIPLATTREYMGGWPWGGADRWQGYGLARVAGDLALGRLLDHGRLPVLTALMVVGILLAVRRLRASASLRVTLVCMALFVFFLMGRRTFGHLVDVQPANLGLQLFRYVGPVHLFAVLLCGAGLAWILRRLWPYAPLPLFVLAVVPLLVAPHVSLYREATRLFRTMDSYEITPAEVAAVGRAVTGATRRGSPPGRVYAHNKTGHGSHLVAAQLARHTDQPMGQSYGVGLHDSLGFYFLEHIEPTDSAAMALYNFRHVVARPDSAFARKQAELGRAPILRRGQVALYSLPGDHGYFQTADLYLTLVGAPRQIRPAALIWARSDWPAAGQYGRIQPEPSAFPGGLVLRAEGKRVFTLGKTRRPVSKLWPPEKIQSPGRVLQQQVGLNRHGARVRMGRPGALVLKVAHHPFWTVEVNGEARPVVPVTPSFPAVELPAGEHEVTFTFRNPAYQKGLLLGAVLAWLAALAWLWRRRGGARKGSKSVG